MGRISIVSIGRPPAAANGLTKPFADYLLRCQKMQKVQHLVFPREEAFRRHLAQDTGMRLTLLHSEGKTITSEAFAASIRQQLDAGVRNLTFAVGPADGWSREILGEPQHAHLSLGPMTLPHELARVVLAEQIYRALTILAGHPYHCGH